jgi:hypothetical protein
MQTQELTAHPAFPPEAIRAVEVRFGFSKDWLQLRWRVDGSGKVVLPPFVGSQRRDGLWETTCFEMFLLGEDETYAEFNFSPSEAWAAYDFDGWREGMAERFMEQGPVITPRKGRNVLIVDVALPLSSLPGLPASLSLTCVIEEEGGTKSYWAMAHGQPDKPDFHDPACFIATLPAPEAS